MSSLTFEQKNLQRQLSVSEERNSKLEECVRQWEGWAAHLEKKMEQQRLSLTGNGIVYHWVSGFKIPFYYRWEIHGSAVHPCIHHKYQERMECSAYPLPKVSGCYDNSKLMTKNMYSYERFVQGLRKLINEMFEAPFASSSVGVIFSRYNTLTVGIPDDGSTRDHLIEFSITPPTVKNNIKGFLP